MAQRCGDHGGVTNSGEPCGRRVKDGRCADHREEAGATRQHLKKRVVALLRDELRTLAEAARAVGVDRVTVWRWRQADEDFDAEVEEALQFGESLQVEAVEASLFRRCVSGEASAAEVIFFLKNRAPHRWKDKVEVERKDEREILIVFQDPLPEVSMEELENDADVIIPGNLRPTEVAEA